ncbi:MAG: gluconokinase [Clostridium sp.]|jgi:gluconokinase
MFEAVINTIKYVVNENDKNNNKLLGVSFSSAMHGIMAVNEKGDKLTDCIIWADTKSTQYSQNIKNSKVGHEIYMKTGTPIHPMSPL